MDAIVTMPYALITPFNNERMIFDLEQNQELKIVSRTPLVIEIVSPDIKAIVYLKLVSNPDCKPLCELDELRSFDGYHRVVLISELVRKAKGEGESYAKQIKNYLNCFDH